MSRPNQTFSYIGDRNPKELKKPTLQYYVFSVIFSLYVVFAGLLRSSELVALISVSPIHWFMLIGATLACLSLFVKVPETPGFTLRRFGIVVLVLVQLKQEMDWQLGKTSLSSRFLEGEKFLAGHVMIVTGANSGVGKAISEKLADLGATVVMACRNEQKCTQAAKDIRTKLYLKSIDEVTTDASGNENSKSGSVEIMQLDLSSLKSVKRFTSSFERKYQRLDALINNAGSMPDPGTVTAEGIEEAFGTMHLGHAALTKWLLPLLRRKVLGVSATSASRIVFVGSQAYLAGNFHSSLMQGDDGFGDLFGEMTDNCGNIGPFNLAPCCPLLPCPNTNGIARAKLSNVLYVHELQRRLDETAIEAGGEKKVRRVVASVIHPGSVRTKFHPFADFAPVSFVLRSSAEAARVIEYAIVEDRFVPGSYIDSMLRGHDLFDYKGRFLHKHLAAFPTAGALPFVRTDSIEIPSADKYFWAKKSLLVPSNSTANGEQAITKDDVAARLWHVTENIIKKFERNKSIDSGKKNEREKFKEVKVEVWGS